MTEEYCFGFYYEHRISVYFDEEMGVDPEQWRVVIGGLKFPDGSPLMVKERTLEAAKNSARGYAHNYIPMPVKEIDWRSPCN